MAGRKIRSQLLLVLVVALAPLVGILVWQWFVTLEDARGLVTSQLHANARTLADAERDPFVIAEHAMSFAAAQSDVRDIGPRCNAILRDALHNTYGILNFLRTDAQGRARCSVLPFTDGLDMSRDRWWNDVRSLRHLYLAEPEVGRISRQPVLIMAQPLINANGAFNGTISAGIGLEQLRDSIRDKRERKSSIVAITDENGKVVLAPHDNWLGAINSVRQAQITPQQFSTADGVDWTFVSVPLYRDELFLVYAEPQDAVRRAALGRMWPNLVLPLLTVILASAALWVGTRFVILRWLNQLRLRTAQFAQGDYRGASADFDRAPEELEQFAGDLHRMADAVAAKEVSLRTALSTTEALTREVNHRVKNNLQIINSLLSIQAENLSDPEAALALSRARVRIAALGLIHRLLYDNSSDGAMGTLAVGQLIPELCAQLRASFRDRERIALEGQSDHFELSGDMAVPLALLIVETVLNCFDHAFPANRVGHIMVTLQAEGETARLRIADDGVGAPADAQQRLGTELVQAFVGQLGGALRTQTGEKGTIVELIFTPEVAPLPIASPG